MTTFTKKEIAQIKRNTIQRVISASMHILEDSNLFGSSLWPKKGFQIGYAINKPNNDIIWVCCNANGTEDVPITGRLVMNRINEYDSPRGQKQNKQIRLIMDEAVFDNVYFEDEFRDSSVLNYSIWLKFTINE